MSIHPKCSYLSFQNGGTTNITSLQYLKQLWSRCYLANIASHLVFSKSWVFSTAENIHAIICTLSPQPLQQATAMSPSWSTVTWPVATTLGQWGLWWSLHVTLAILWSRDLSPSNAWIPTIPSGMRPSLPVEVCMSQYCQIEVIHVHLSIVYPVLITLCRSIFHFGHLADKFHLK